MPRLRFKHAFTAALLPTPLLGWRRYELYAVDHYNKQVDPASRLGAYQATAGYKEGTVGNTAHRAIGTMYVLWGSWAEDRIGLLFRTVKMRLLLPLPVTSKAESIFNQIEYKDWEKQDDIGGELATFFPPDVRTWVEVHIFFKQYNFVVHLENKLKEWFK